MAQRLPGNSGVVWAFRMNWTVAVIAAQITGGLLFWRLCSTAPVMTEDYIEDDDSTLEPTDERQHGPDQEADPGDHHEQHPAQDCHRAKASEQPPSQADPWL
ncbi:hypothetical protein [Methylobacterium sp. E-046]|uniref:hypothetical protein n=1 Tax=Methylobacterium sp. E-046 TaxID=2836576 RepID=UPI001FB9CF66|nr:hypothetical protein [Methylobacterium sp. E-046]MCJ2098631.1 hypothetical protein [Methylobacterium sp. E-046]